MELVEGGDELKRKTLSEINITVGIIALVRGVALLGEKAPGPSVPTIILILLLIV